MPEHFSLVRRAWIPVALSDGKRVFVRPGDISQPHDGQAIIRIATGRPDCDISLTEFLIGLLAVTMGPETRRDWVHRYRNPPSRDELEAAFVPLEPPMMLDGEGARFFQDAETLTGEPNGIDALFIDAPGTSTIRDNADHFVKRGRTNALSRAGAAIALATLQTSAPSGGAGHRTSLRGGGPLTTLVLPGQPGKTEPTLWQSLWANVPNRQDDDALDLKRVFPWLSPTRVSDKAGVETTPTDVDPLQCFFGMPRRIRLVFEANPSQLPCDLLGIVDDVIVTGYVTRPWGTNYTAWSQGHPLSPYYRPKKDAVEYLPLHLQSSRVGYRQYLGLALKSEASLRLPARSVSEFYTRAQEFRGVEKQAAKNSRLVAAGYAMDNMKPLDFGEALMPLIVTGDPSDDGLVHDFAERFVKAADLVANQLTNAVRRALYGETTKADRDSTVLDAVRQRFWADTEQDFYAALRDTAEALIAAKEDSHERIEAIRQERGKVWLADMRKSALAIFDDAVPIEDAESDRIKDVIEGRKMLMFALTGFGAVGTQIFAALQLPPMESKAKKGRRAA